MNNNYLLSLLICILLISCQDKKKVFYEDKGEVFHTHYSIKYEYFRPLTAEILAELAKFDDSLNPFKDSSVISKVNMNQEVELDSFFIEVFRKSEEVSKVTNGAFDITCSPLINAWGFGFKHMDNVTPQLIDSLRSFVGYNKIKLENGRIVKKDPRVQINTSAIAKGYSCDVVARLFDSLGIKNYMCEIGGEIVMKGVNPYNECWKIGVDKPVDDKLAENRVLQTILQVCDKSVATSGNYRNFYIKDGKKYAHTIDPKTGYPAENTILGVTVIANDCMTADAYATAFMLSSIEDTKRIAKEQNLSYYIIYGQNDGSVTTTQSDDFETYIVK